MRAISTLQDVVDWRLCIGCGACVPACPHGVVSLRDIAREGIRPRIDLSLCASCGDCTAPLGVCPGWRLDGELMTGPKPRKTEWETEYGPALEVWEGHAADPGIRFQGSSGAMLTALALYGLERGGMEFALHTGADPAQPWRNQTVVSRTRDELVGRAGSRYAPASPCDGLDIIERSTGPCIFIGKPCDAAAAAMSCRQRAVLRQKMGIILTFFCAGTPSTQGTLNLLKMLGVETDEIQTLRYRGEGWPGRFKAVTRAGRGERSLSYEDSWDNLNRYRPFRCHLCPDGLGRVADLSCGDAWHRHAGDGDPGRSIVLVRTAAGQAFLRGAVNAGYVKLEALDPGVVLEAQKNLLERRRQLFGRLLAMQMTLTPRPQFHGFSLARSWLKLPAGMKARTVLGTLKRIAARGLWKRRAEPGECGTRNEECGVRN